VRYAAFCEMNWASDCDMTGKEFGILA